MKMHFSPDLAREPAQVSLVLYGPSNHTHHLPVPKCPIRASSCLHTLAHMVSSVWQGPLFLLSLEAPPLGSHSILNNILMVSLPQSCESPGQGEVLDSSKSLNVSNGQDNIWPVANTRKHHLNCLPPSPPSPSLVWNLSKALATSMLLWRY